jgi:hypothetical protein
LNGDDVMNNCSYEGFVYQQEIVGLIQDTNDRNGTKIRLWNYEAIADALASNVGLAKILHPVTNELSGKNKKSGSGVRYALVMEKAATPFVRNIQSVGDRERILRDGQYLIDKYNAMMLKHEMMNRKKAAEAKN